MEDSALFDFRFLRGRRDLSASFLIPQIPGFAFGTVPLSWEGGLQVYRWMQGLLPVFWGRVPYQSPDGTFTRWAFSGDPRTHAGAIDGMDIPWSGLPGDRRFLLSTGPFAMTLGDRQEVVFALVGADGSSRLDNTYYLKWFTKFLHQYYPDLASLRSFAETPPVEEPSPPLEFRLEQNYPKTFNPVTVIRIQLPESSQAKLEVFDVMGRVISTLIDERREAGTYDVMFDGSALASGLYFYRMQAGHYIQTREMVVIH